MIKILYLLREIENNRFLWNLREIFEKNFAKISLNLLGMFRVDFSNNFSINQEWNSAERLNNR